MGQKKTAPLRQSVLEDTSFGQELENMLHSKIGEGGYMQGSLSGESWKTFLHGLRQEAIGRLRAYRGESCIDVGFRASSLQPYCEERMRIEREYVRGLVKLYGDAERTYKSLSG